MLGQENPGLDKADRNFAPSIWQTSCPWHRQKMWAPLHQLVLLLKLTFYSKVKWLSFMNMVLAFHITIMGWVIQITGSPLLSYTVPSWKLVSQNVQKSINRLVHYGRGSVPIAVNIHKNPCVWATNETVVAAMTVHSCIISTKGNCYCSHHHISQYPP